MQKKFGVAVKVVIIILLLIGFIFINNYISENNKRSFKIREEDDDITYQIESIDIEGEEIVIKGWFFELKKIRNIEKDNLDNSRIGIVLYDINSNNNQNKNPNEEIRKGIGFNVSYMDREDVNEYFKCEYDYSHCGFVARAEKSNIDLINGEYQVIIKPDENGIIGIPVDAFLDKGTFLHINPKDYISIEVNDPELEKIIKEGVFLVSYPEYHIYVYQYKWKLYWIADEQYMFDNNGNTCIQYQINTTQFDRLPQDRTMNGWYWSNISESFEKNEIFFDESNGYRISVRDIPGEYSCVDILTGFYENGKWIWKKHIKPIYDF